VPLNAFLTFEPGAVFWRELMLLVAFLSWRESCGAALLVGKETRLLPGI